LKSRDPREGALTAEQDQPRPAPAGCPPLDEAGLRATLEAAGLRCTRQRAAVYAFLGRAPHHPTAEEVYRGVQGVMPNISLATVYKALEALVACGLAAKLTANDGSARYDARDDDHYHLRCLRTGRVEDLPTAYDPDLIARLDPDIARLLEDRGFHLTGYRLELVGYFEPAAEGASDPR
jgi:Fe2+ or Zn2+ uptake regulation protein